MADPQDSTTPTATATPSPTPSPSPTPQPDNNRQVVLGPDKKYWSFKKDRSPEYINSYFTKKGWVLKDGKWFTANGESVGEITKVPPLPTTGDDVLKRKEKSLDKMGQFTTDASIAVAAAGPTLLGMAGGMLGRTPGAILGGAMGGGIKDLAMDSILDTNLSAGKIAKDMLWNGAVQGGLEKVGGLAGEKFFNLLNKMPHAVEIQGIPILPQDIQPGNKLMSYTSDLLRNLAPASRTMEEFDARQSAIIIDKAKTLANGFAKFDGTSEQLGTLVQKVFRDADLQYQKTFSQMYRDNINKGMLATNAKKDVQSSPLGQKYIANFKNALVTEIIKKDKPQLITGLLLNFATKNEDAALFNSTLKELSPETLGKVQNIMIRDAIYQDITGAKDPTLKGATNLADKFSGAGFKSIFDKAGESKLRALYGDKAYEQALAPFIELVGPLGNRSAGGGVGKFLNLMFLLPFRSGLSFKGQAKVVAMALLANRAAKVITSPEGMKIYENYIRATAQQAPRAIAGLTQEMIAFNDKSDKEYELEQEIAKDRYQKERMKMPQARSTAFGTQGWREKQLLQK